MKEAMFYESDGSTVRCGLCRFRCSIRPGSRGICGVRENVDGVLYTLVYGKAVAGNADPIEKKPLFHVLPGSRSYSIATAGCNFRCLHCQNHSISQVSAGDARIVGHDLPPERVVQEALDAGCSSISYTYTEPTIFFEYALETARLARERGLLNIFVTNGYITPEALACIAPYLDAANIDLKGFSDRFYREVVHAMREEVLDCILDYRKHGIWIELTTLLIPGFNDSREEVEATASFIAEKVGVETPWHVSAFFPTYRLHARPTPPETLLRAREAGLQAGLRYVYTGNIPGEGGEDTFCAGCGARVIARHGYRVGSNRLAGDACAACATPMDGIFRNETTRR
ncbi:MAG TPA: AmmeMemoRadiSam system radical SAM enzyme [Verrucomicrobiae bacterium]|nr:AmmeMemoRadiSam system radical SAM enzyme [Verrucomicrobiae bacterium]